MNLLSAEKITKNFGSKVLYNQLTFGIGKNEKVGLIGINGTGKSTLLKMLVGSENPDQGQIICATNVKIGYLPQNPTFHKDYTVLEEVIQGNSQLMTLVRTYEEVLIKAEQNLLDKELQKKLLLLGNRWMELKLGSLRVKLEPS